MGHYWTMLECLHHDNNTIPGIIVNIAYMSLITASPLKRWQTASQITFDKGKGRFVENLRIMQLCEADLNFVLHIIWGHRLIHHANKHSGLDKAQYIIPGQTCNNAVLNKVLFFDLSRQSLSPGILSDFDVTAAFDRVIAGISIITCERVGLPRSADIFMYQLLQKMRFHLITGFGQSISSYSNTKQNVTGQGVLQGSSSACPIFILNSSVALSAYHKHGTGATFTHRISHKKVIHYAVQFVDDTSQFVNPQGMQSSDSSEDPTILFDSMVHTASYNAQRWADYLWLSDGNLYLAKCFHYALRPYINYKTNSIEYDAISSEKIFKIKNPSDNKYNSIQGLPPSEACCTLGVVIAPVGKGSTQLRHSTLKTKEFFAKFSNASLSPKAN